eukprot:COSAG02_NODE_1809_length_10835_cov_7.682843_5_plen_94_part_00
MVGVVWLLLDSEGSVDSSGVRFRYATKAGEMPEAFPGEELERPLVDAAADRSVDVIGMPGAVSGEKPTKVCCMRGVTSMHTRTERLTKAAFAV